MKYLKGCLSTIVAGLVSAIIVPSALAGVVPLENRLPAWGDYNGTPDTGYPRINFTGVDITYKNGRTKKGVTSDTVFFGASNASTVLSLDAFGYDNVVFDGDFIIDANISSKGVLRSGSTFGFYSNDTNLFGTGNETTYGCKGQNLDKGCSTGQLVFGGELQGFGWSGSQGILEFLTGNLSGWAMDNWNPNANPNAQEHIYMDVGAFTLNDVSSVKSFNAVADGFAVVPVPAAAWLFGTGLLGLVGLARRKRS